MYSFAERVDCSVWDEPFYAAYLKASGLAHPMQDEIMASQSSDPSVVANQMRASDPDHAIVYQKHMTHHMVDALPRDWMSDVTNVFLIRPPARVLRSYARKMETVSLEATGFPQQLSLFQHAHRMTRETPIVIDSNTILADPPTALQKLCEALKINWDDRMLRWDKGPKPEDGAWAPHWYDAVWASTGFGQAATALPDLPSDLQTIQNEAMAIYETLLKAAI